MCKQFVQFYYIMYNINMPIVDKPLMAINKLIGYSHLKYNNLYVDIVPAEKAATKMVYLEYSVIPWLYLVGA